MPDEVVFQTSGSTGVATRVIRTERSLTEDAANLVRQFSPIWSARPTVVASVRTEHLYGALWVARAPRLAGCDVVARTVLSVEELQGLADEKGPLLFVTTPSFLERALEHPDFKTLRGDFAAIVTSGSMLREETARAVEASTGVCPLEIYGSTEAGTIAWRQQTKDARCTLVDGVRAVRTDEGLISVDSPFAAERPIVLKDNVVFIDDRHFELKGRSDRQVKILESFVSLQKVEQALAAHPYVSRVRVEPLGTGIARLGAVLVPSPEGTAALVARSFADVAACLRADLRARLQPLEIPRRFRFVRVLPTDERGKTTVEAIRNVLTAWCAEPVVLAWQATATTLTARLEFPPDLTCFKGHFPGMPILPGVAQLMFIRHFARQAFPDFPEAATYRKLKFKNVIRPGSQQDLTVMRRTDGAFSFALGNAAQGDVVPC